MRKNFGAKPFLNALNMTPPPIPIPPHQWISLRTQKFSIT